MRIPTVAVTLLLSLPLTAAPIAVGALSFNELIPAGPSGPGINVFDIQNFTGIFALPPDLPVVNDVTFRSAVLELFQGGTLFSTIVLGDIGPGALVNGFGDPLVQVPGDLQFTSVRLLATVDPTVLQLDGGGSVQVVPTIDAALSGAGGGNLRIGNALTFSVETVNVSAVPEPGSAGLLLTAAGSGLLLLRRFRPRRTAVAAAWVLAFAGLSARAQNLVNLQPATTPLAGLPGVTNMSVVGGNFPAGGVVPELTTVTLTPVTSGPAMTATTLRLFPVGTTVCRVDFRFNGPNVPAPTAYYVYVAGPGFVTRSPARMTVNPGPAVSLVPSTATAGSAVTVNIAGQNTNFLQGVTAAAFGPGVTVNSLTVSSPTVAAARVTVAPTAPVGPRTVTVSTGVQSATAAFTITDPANSAPRITSSAPSAGKVGDPYVYDVTAADSDNDLLTYSLVNPPAGMNIGPSTGHLTWTPAAEGTFNATVQVSDGRGGLASQPFTVVVTGVVSLEPKLKYGFARPPQVSATGAPVVVDLDKDGTPEVVFGALGPSQLSLYAINGATGVKKWSVDGDYTLFQGEIATGDLDLDGYPEVVVITWAGANPRRRIRAYSHDGTEKWVSNDLVDGVNITATRGPVRLALANITGDARPEIIFGHTGRTADMLPSEFEEKLVTVLNDRGQHLFTRRLGRIKGGLETVTVADIDQDGQPEILYGGSAVSNTGALEWVAADANQYVGDAAVANLDSDSFAEIVYLDITGHLWCVEHTGVTKWPRVAVPSAGASGSLSLPVIGDVDGDGLPEILVVRGSAINVFSRTGTLVRTITLPQDGSGGNATVFDLNGDGRPEIVHHGVSMLTILDGPSGGILHSIPVTRNSNPLLTPVIADIDGDGAAEIALGGGNDQSALLRVFEAKSGHWSPARRVANQQEYSVTNVNEDGSIPAVPAINWLTPRLNNYRVYAKP